jgi:hypothetical protein
MRDMLMDIAGVYAMRSEPRIESLDQLGKAISKI